MKALALLAFAAGAIAMSCLGERLDRRDGMAKSSCISGLPSTALGMWTTGPIMAAMAIVVLS